MNPLGAFILVVLIAVVLGASRRLALLAMMAGVMFLTQMQSVNVAGLNLFAIRFLEVAGFIRVMARHEFSFRQLNGIDKTLIWLYGFSTVVFLLRGEVGQANQIGIAVDAFLCYFTFRGLVSNMDDFRRFLRGFALLLAPYALLVAVELMTWHNAFTVLGGIEMHDIKWTRHGLPRCFGSFRQPDTLGMFGASFLPIFLGLACIARERKRALVGICFCLIIAGTSNSGGPISAVGIGLACWAMWPFRTQMRLVRWGIVAMLAALAIVMKDPVWYIFDRASGLTGGDGWHRSYLIQMAYEHFGKWWIAGMDYMDTQDWFPYDLPETGAADITNQFINFGITAGLVAVGLFIFLLTRAFSFLGQALAAVRTNRRGSSGGEFLLWGLGAMLVVHIIDWFGVTYFDQMYMVWFMQLAAISTLAQLYLARPAAVPAEEAVIEPEAEEPEPTVGLGQSNAPHTIAS